MPPILNMNCFATCPHQVPFKFIPKQQQVLVGNAPALTIADVPALPSGPCPNVGPGLKPCTTLNPIPTPTVTMSRKVLIKNQPALLQTFIGITDCVPPVPPAPAVKSPGQMTVIALS